MRYFDGLWHYHGRVFTSLHDALLSVWPRGVAANP